MRFVFFIHSLLSDWNHGNAHFLRGIVRELQGRGHTVVAYEPRSGWSRSNLIAHHGTAALDDIRAVFPDLSSIDYDLDGLDLDEALDGADVVIAHEWNEPELIQRLARHRIGGGRYRLLFHDTHHRAVSDRKAIAGFHLDGFDGVLAFGEVIREIYLREGWSQSAWTWHEAADVSVFRPHLANRPAGDLVWIGNWGDGERSAELAEFLLQPIQLLRLKATVHGVRYPRIARAALAKAGARYGGWLPNHRAPELFGQYGVTVHVPRRPYVDSLPGIPTIRVFEALACGIPLVCSPWRDSEGLFRPGQDFLMAGNGVEMERAVGAVLQDPDLAAELARNGLETILSRHTCAHRVDQLLSICGELGLATIVAAAE